MHCIACMLLLVACSDKDNDTPPPAPIIPVEGKDFAPGWSVKKISDTVVWDIQFVNASTGFCVGDGLFKTSDAGNTWTNIKAPEFPKGKLLEYCSFIDANTGWITEQRGKRIFKTTDGGKTFTVSAISGNENLFLQQIKFINPLIGFVTSTQGLYKTTDGGISWTKIMNELCVSICVYDENNFWVGGNNTVWRTTDGSTFTRRNLGIMVVSIQFFDKMNGLALDSHSALFQTSDGGLTWNFKLRVELGVGSNDLSFSDPHNGYITDHSGVVKINGTEKSRVVTVNGSVPFEIFFTDPDHGYVCSAKGFIYKYTAPK